MAQEAFAGSADPNSLQKTLDGIAGGITAGFKVPRQELAEFVKQNRDTYAHHTMIVGVIDRIKKSDPQLALAAARIVIDNAHPNSLLEDAALSKWREIAGEIAGKDVFAALNGEVMYAAVLSDGDRHFKAIAVGEWEQLFSRALHQDPAKAAEAAERALEFAYNVRHPDVMPESTTARIIEVAKDSLILARLAIVSTQLAQQRPPGPGLKP